MNNEIDIKKSNRTLYLTLLLLLVTVVLVALFFSFYLRNMKQISQSRVEYDEYYAMITDNRKASFWQSIYQGAYEWGLSQGIYVELFGDNLQGEYTKIDLMKMAISSKVDGIILEADESEELTQLIDQATAEGIPVVTLINDNTQSKRCSFVGVSGYNIGREYGRQIKEVYNEIRNEDPSKSVNNDMLNVAVLVNYSGQASGQNIILAGLQETIDKELGSGARVEVSLVTVNDSNAFSVEESVRDIFINQETPDVFVALDELTTTCVYQAIVDHNKVGAVRILGYHNSDIINNAINRGAIYSTILVDTAQLGRCCIDALKEYNELGATSQYFTADTTLINRSNVSMYLQTQEGENDDD